MRLDTKTGMQLCVSEICKIWECHAQCLRTAGNWQCLSELFWWKLPFQSSDPDPVFLCVFVLGLNSRELNRISKGQQSCDSVTSLLSSKAGSRNACSKSYFPACLTFSRRRVLQEWNAKSIRSNFQKKRYRTLPISSVFPRTVCYWWAVWVCAQACWNDWRNEVPCAGSRGWEYSCSSRPRCHVKSRPRWADLCRVAPVARNQYI